MLKMRAWWIWAGVALFSSGRGTCADSPRCLQAASGLFSRKQRFSRPCCFLIGLMRVSPTGQLLAAGSN